MILVFENSNLAFLRASLYKNQEMMKQDLLPYAYLSKPNGPGALEALTEESQRLEDNTQQRWLLTGGVLVIGGLLAGVAIKARPRRSGWS